MAGSTPTYQGIPVASSRQRRTHLLAPLVALLLALAAGACSDADTTEVSSDPEMALRGAVEAVGDWSGIRVRATLDADDAARASLVAEGELGDTEVDVVLGASLTATVSASDDPDRGGLELVLALDGKDVAELRVTDEQRSFARLDLDALEAAADDPELAPADLRDLLAAARPFGLGDLADAVVEGRWVELFGLDAVADLAGQPEDEVDDAAAEAAERIADRTSTFIERDVEVTSVGSDELGERVRASTTGGAFRDHLDAVTAELDQGGLVDEVGDDLDATLEDLPDHAELTLDAWIRDGQLQQVAVGLLGLVDERDLDGELWLVLRLEEYTDTIAPPDGATAIDLFELFGAFLGGGAGGGLDLRGGPGDDGSDAGTLEDGAVDGGTLEDDGVEQDDLAGAVCITDEELEEVTSLLGEEGLAEIEALLDTGVLERC